MKVIAILTTYLLAIIFECNGDIPAFAGSTASNGLVKSITVINGGSGYTSPPNVWLTGGGGYGAKAVAIVSGGEVVSIIITSSGAGYIDAPYVTVAPPSTLSVRLIRRLQVEGVVGSSYKIEWKEPSSNDWWALSEGAIKKGGVDLIELSDFNLNRQYRLTETVPGFVLVRPGTFNMGSPESELGRWLDESFHAVTLNRPFWISDHEVTQFEYEALIGNNPSFFRGTNLPVNNLTWESANDYCNQLTARERSAGRIGHDQRFRLPTEAEWEYAARSGTMDSTYGDLNEISWNSNNSGGKLHAIRLKVPNASKLHEMLGNVSEWCSDWYGQNKNSHLIDPIGPSIGVYRVVRGGSFLDGEFLQRLASRGKKLPNQKSFDVGFRPVLTAKDELYSNPAIAAKAVAKTSFGFVTNVSVILPGDGYVSIPNVSFLGGGGTGASARAQLVAGKVSSIDIISSGHGYSSPPDVLIDPPPPSLGIHASVMPSLIVAPKAMAKYQILTAPNPNGPWVFWTNGSASPFLINNVNLPSLAESYFKVDFQYRTNTYNLNLIENGDFSDNKSAKWVAANGDKGYVDEKYFINTWDLLASQETDAFAEPGTLAIASIDFSTIGRDDDAGRAGTFFLVAGKVNSSQPGSFGDDAIVLQKAVIGNPQYNNLMPDSLVGNNKPTNIVLTYAFHAGDAALGLPLTIAFRTEKNSVGKTYWDNASVSIIKFNQNAGIDLVRQPESATLGIAQPLKLSVLAVGFGVKYQWQINRRDIIGATNSFFSVIAPKVTDVGEYRVIINSDFGSAVSEEVNVKFSSLAEMGFKWINPGYFLMGESRDVKQKVELTTGFWLSDHEVTQKEYETVIGTNPSKFKGLDLPVENIDWGLAVKYCQRLTDICRLNKTISPAEAFRLPTVAEWEYAARGNTAEDQYGDINQIAWYDSNSSRRTHPVKEKEANPWGLYDMIGNVSEWCLDKGNYFRMEVLIDPIGDTSDSQDYRDVCGGNWNDWQFPFQSVGYRLQKRTYERSNQLGFRPALSAVVWIRPEITGEPQSIITSAGQEIKLRVYVQGIEPISYQWLRNGNSVSGATKATLTIGNVQTAHAGDYKVVVSNAAGSITSATAKLTVNP